MATLQGEARSEGRKKAQVDHIAEALLAGEMVTPLAALNRWGCFRLASTIHRLRQEEKTGNPLRRGFSIETIDLEEGGKHFAGYKLVAPLAAEVPPPEDFKLEAP